MQSRVEQVREIVDALNRGDVDGMLARMHPDFEWRPLEASPVARVYRGHEEVRHYVEDWLATMEDLRIELVDPAETGDQVVSMVRAYGRGTASGLEVDTSFRHVWTVRDGLAVALEEHP